MRSTISTTFLLVATLALTACGADEAPADAAPSMAEPNPELSTEIPPEASAEIDCEDPSLSAAAWMRFCEGEQEEVELAVTSEGSVATPDGSFIEYPDGLKITLTAVEDVSFDVRNENSFFLDDPSVVEEWDMDYRIYAFVSTWENVGDEAIDLSELNAALNYTAMTGENRYPVEWAYAESAEATSTEPAQLAPGTSHEHRLSFYYSREDDGQPMSYTVNTGSMYTPYTFTDAETLLPEWTEDQRLVDDLYYQASNAYQRGNWPQFIVDNNHPDLDYTVEECEQGGADSDDSFSLVTPDLDSMTLDEGWSLDGSRHDGLTPDGTVYELPVRDLFYDTADDYPTSDVETQDVHVSIRDGQAYFFVTCEA